MFGARRLKLRTHLHEPVNDALLDLIVDDVLVPKIKDDHWLGPVVCFHCLGNNRWKVLHIWQ